MTDSRSVAINDAPYQVSTRMGVYFNSPETIYQLNAGYSILINYLVKSQEDQRSFEPSRNLRRSPLRTVNSCD